MSTVYHNLSWVSRPNVNPPNRVNDPGGRPKEFVHRSLYSHMPVPIVVTTQYMLAFGKPCKNVSLNIFVAMSSIDEANIKM